MNNPTDLTGKTAFITGAARGIGRAIAGCLADSGAEVVIADLRYEEAQATAAQLRQCSGRAVHAVRADVTSLSDMQAARDEALRLTGKIDILVNNAGWDKLAPFLKTTPELWDRVIGINYRGVLNTCYAILPHMVERKTGVVVNISSDSARVGSLGESVYAGCKAAVIAFSKTLAREHARDNIRVNVICPGLVDTPLLAEMQQEEFPKKILGAVTGATPLKRLGQPEEIALAALFLASDAAGYITGQVLGVDGGLVMAG
jgi:2-hydroxycyclohexanecarboxyl-CoA dehydrogenase